MHHISLRQIHIFEAVARYQSHTKAAAILHMSQPAVSMQMKQMEKSLDIKLIERDGKSITLTREAQSLRKYTQKIVQSYQSLESYVDNIQGAEEGHLVISATNTANHFTSRILSAFARLHPNVNLSLDVTNRKTILSQLEHNEPDQVIMGEPPEGLDLDWEILMDNPLVIIAPADHPLRDEENIPLKQIFEEKFVSRESGSGTRKAIERHIKEHGIHCESGLEMSSNEAIKLAVAAGFGLGIVSEHTIELEVKSSYLCTLNVETFPILRHWHLVTRQGKPLSHIAAAFRQFIVDECKKKKSG
ncbi:MAG: LysR family transcriptional regulator [Thiotrichaceae bacterium]